MMATASPTTVPAVGPKRGWRRRLRTCGIVGVVALTALLAAVYAASWSSDLMVFYVAQGTKRSSVMGLGVGRGLGGLSTRDKFESDMFSPRSLEFWRVSHATGERRTKTIPFPNLPWLAMDLSGTVSLRLEIPLAVLVATSAWLIARRVRAARAARRGSCSKCGYDLTGLPRQSDGSAAVCPECGRAAVIQPDATPPLR